MSKTAKKIIAMITTFSIAFGMFTFKPAKAIDMNLVDACMDSALTCGTFYHYNMAYNTVLQIEDENLRNPYLWKLAEIAPKVWNSELANLIDRLNTIPQTKSGKSYDEIHKAITECKLNKTDKKYLLNELCSWGKKMVYTEDYTRALDALILAWDTKSQEDIDKAQELIEKVEHKANKAYLNDELNKVIISNTEYIIDGEIKLENAKIKNILIFDKDGNKLKNKDDYSITTSNEKFNLMIFNKDIDEVKTVIYGENFEVTENTMKLEKGSNKMEVKAVEGGQAQIKLNLKDKRGNDLIKSGVTVKIIDKYGLDFGTSDKDAKLEDGLFISSKILSKGEYKVSIEKDGRYNGVNEVIQIDEENITKELTKTIKKKSSSSGSGDGEKEKPKPPTKPEDKDDTVIKGSEIDGDTITLEKDQYKDIKIESNGKKIDLKDKTIDGTLTINGTTDVDIINCIIGNVVVRDEENAGGEIGKSINGQNDSLNKQVYVENSQVNNWEIDVYSRLSILLEGSKNNIKNIELKSPVIFENGSNADAIDNMKVNLRDDVKESKVEIIGNFLASKILINSGKNINIDALINELIIDGETNINITGESKIENIEINNSKVELLCDESSDINTIAEVINNAKINDNVDNDTIKDIANKINDEDFKQEKIKKEKNFIDEFNKYKKDDSDDSDTINKKEEDLKDLIFSSEYKYVKYNTRVKNYTEYEKETYAGIYMDIMREKEFTSIDEINRCSSRVYNFTEAKIQSRNVMGSDMVIYNEEQDVTDKLFDKRAGISDRATINVLSVKENRGEPNNFQIRKDDQSRDRLFYVPNSDKSSKEIRLDVMCKVSYLDGSATTTLWSQVYINNDKEEVELIDKLNSYISNSEDHLDEIRKILFESGKFDFSYVSDDERYNFTRSFMHELGMGYRKVTSIESMQYIGDFAASMLAFSSQIKPGEINIDDIKPKIGDDVTELFIKENPEKPIREDMELIIDKLVYDKDTSTPVEGFEVKDGRIIYVGTEKSIKNRKICVSTKIKFRGREFKNIMAGMNLTLNGDGENTIIDEINEITTISDDNIKKMKDLLFGKESPFKFSQEIVTEEEKDSFAKQYILAKQDMNDPIDFVTKEDIENYAPKATIKVQFDKLKVNEDVVLTDKDKGEDVTRKFITNFPYIDIDDNNEDLDGRYPRKIFEYMIYSIEDNHGESIDGFCIEKGKIKYNGSKKDIENKPVKLFISGKYLGETISTYKTTFLTVKTGE